jgi:hypothetical protein
MKENHCVDRLSAINQFSRKSCINIGGKPNVYSHLVICQTAPTSGKYLKLGPPASLRVVEIRVLQYYSGLTVQNDYLQDTVNLTIYLANLDASLTVYFDWSGQRAGANVRHSFRPVES